MAYKRRNSRLMRLAKKEDSAAVSRIIKLFVISAVLVVFLFAVGIQVLGKFADFLEVFFKGRGDEPSQVQSLQPPILDPLPEATNSARLIVSGFATGGEKAEIYLNDEKLGEAIFEVGKFKYEDLILNEGENRIYAKALGSGDQSSVSSATFTVVFDNVEPKLEISSPPEGQIFSGDNRIKVSGKTEANAQVYANGFLASVNSSGDFEVLVPLNEGENTIEVKAIDEAGNTKVEARKAQYKK